MCASARLYALNAVRVDHPVTGRSSPPRRPPCRPPPLPPSPVAQPPLTQHVCRVRCCASPLARLASRALTPVSLSRRLSPHAQLGFPRPLSELVTRPLLIRNSNKFPVAFKIKTTAPKQYCVKPNSGRIEPGQKTEVQIMLQPMQTEPPLNAKCRDKFLVQSVQIPAQLASVPIFDLWSVVEKQDKDAIREQKLRVAYLPPTSASVPEEPEDGSSAAGSRNGPAKPLTPAQLEAENKKLRAQLASNTSRIPKVPLPLVALLLAVVAAVTAAGVWLAIENDLLKL